jgi:hypothetical protein
MFQDHRLDGKQNISMRTGHPNRRWNRLQTTLSVHLSAIVSDSFNNDIIEWNVHPCLGKQLELLDLSYCTDITDTALCYVAKSSLCLKSLSLKGLDRITRESILELGELRRQHRRLIWLQIYNCKQITSAVIDEMIQRLNDGWRKGAYDSRWAV